MALGGFLTLGIGGGQADLFPLLTGLISNGAAASTTTPAETVYGGFTGMSEMSLFWGNYIHSRRR